MSVKFTPWVEDTPTRTIARLSDQALIDTINLTRTVCKLLRGGGDKLPPVAQMWQFHSMSLHVYGCLAAMELCNKRQNELDAFSEFNTPAREMYERGERFEMPPWFDDDDVQFSHISALTRLDLWRSDEDRIEADDVDEFWPVLWPIMTSHDDYQLMVNKKDREAMAIDDLWLPDEVRSRVVNLD